MLGLLEANHWGKGKQSVNCMQMTHPLEVIMVTKSGKQQPYEGSVWLPYFCKAKDEC